MINDYELGAVVAVQWNPFIAEQFPDADHTSCRQSLKFIEQTGRWIPLNPPLCHDYHCPVCGNACNFMGHHNCQTKGD